MTLSCHQMSKEERRGLAKVSSDIFSKILSYFNVYWPAFFKIKMSRHVTRKGGSPCQCHKMTHGEGRESKIGQTKCQVLFECSLCELTSMKEFIYEFIRSVLLYCKFNSDSVPQLSYISNDKCNHLA